MTMERKRESEFSDKRWGRERKIGANKGRKTNKSERDIRSVTERGVRQRGIQRGGSRQKGKKRGGIRDIEEVGERKKVRQDKREGGIRERGE